MKLRQLFAKPRLIATIISFTLLVGIFTVIASNAWFFKNRHVKASSSQIYAVNQGFAGSLILDTTLQKIYPAGESESEVTIYPGDLVYYTFVFQIDLENLKAEETNYKVQLNMEASDYDGATEEKNGDYLSFLSNCIIQENSCFLVVLEREDEKTGSDGSIGSDGNADFSYTPVSYIYDDGNYRRAVKGDPESETITLFTHDTIGFEDFVNSEVSSFCPDKTEASIGAEFEMYFPVFEDVGGEIQYPIYNESIDSSAGKDCVCFALYVPIWYHDTDELQNEEMYSKLTIKGTTLLPVETTPAG